MGSYYHGFHLNIFSGSCNKKKNESIGQEVSSDTVLRDADKTWLAKA